MSAPALPVEDRLLAAGVRPTTQRVALANLLLDGPRRHVTAAEIWSEAKDQGLPVSLATVYNTLNEFLEAGLLRAVPVTAIRGVYFDTNTEPHHHVLDEDTGEVRDLPAGALEVCLKPGALPDGVEVERLEVWVRVRNKV